MNAVTIVAIHQPNYLPYLGFFHKMLLSDTFVLYDIAQFSKNDFHNRNRIKTSSGSRWLTVPIRRAGLRPILEMEIDWKQPWDKRHAQTIQANYSRSALFPSYAAELESEYRTTETSLAIFNERLIRFLARSIGLEPKFVRASDLRIPRGLTASERIAAIVKRARGESYLSGPAGPGYLDDRVFEGIDLLLQDFHHPTYPQLWGSFLPNLSVLDLLLNVGDKSKQILQTSGATKPWPENAASSSRPE